MAYPEFGDGRRSEARQRKIKILVGAGLTVLLLIFIAAGAFVVVEQDDDDSQPAPKKVSTSNKAVKVMCQSTDYKKQCEKSLKRVLKDHDDSDPKNIIKAAIMVVIEEVVKAFSNSTKLIKSKDPEVKAAVRDCVDLFGHAKDELVRTLNYVDVTDIENLPEKSHDIRTWLSAVMSYQQTCVDGFPDGETKKKVNQVMTSGRELTSNALAIIQQASSILTMLDVQGFRRRLLGNGGADGMPDWLSEEERRFLASRPTANPKPNVTVAKDGSGDFTTINAALSAMPKKYTGRCAAHIM